MSWLSGGDHERRQEAVLAGRIVSLSGNAGNADACRQHGDLPPARRLQGRLLRGVQGDDRLAAARRADPQGAPAEGAARHRSSVLGRGRPVRHRSPYLPRQPAGAARPRHAGTHRRLDARQAVEPGSPALGVLRLRGHEGQRDRALFQDAPCLHRRRGRCCADQHDLRPDAGAARDRAAGREEGRAGAARHRRQSDRRLSAALDPAVRGGRRRAEEPRTAALRQERPRRRSCSTTPCSRSRAR
ncbi:hypothetical protein ACVILL_005262 [Bradyrhizobium sp. USDA 3364]